MMKAMNNKSAKAQAKAQAIALKKQKKAEAKARKEAKRQAAVEAKHKQAPLKAKRKELDAKRQKKGFVWYATRAGFLTMLISGVIFASIFSTGFFNSGFFISYLTQWAMVIISLICTISAFFTFVMSIIHLFRHRKHGLALAIVSLILSGGVIALSAFAGYLLGLVK